MVKSLKDQKILPSIETTQVVLNHVRSGTVKSVTLYGILTHFLQIPVVIISKFKV